MVIAILALLVSLLMPSLRKAQYLAREAVCVSNVHALGTGLILYASDADGKYPWRGDRAGYYDAKQWSNDNQVWGWSTCHEPFDLHEVLQTYAAAGPGYICPFSKVTIDDIWPGKYTSYSADNVYSWDYATMAGWAGNSWAHRYTSDGGTTWERWASGMKKVFPFSLDQDDRQWRPIVGHYVYTHSSLGDEYPYRSPHDGVVEDLEGSRGPLAYGDGVVTNGSSDWVPYFWDTWSGSDWLAYWQLR